MVSSVAERGRDRVVRLPDRDGDGIADGIEVVADRLNRPSSIAFYRGGSLYVGETGRVLRLSEPDSHGTMTRVEVVIDGLPSEGGHNTRTVLFSPDWRWLYVSVGSSCNVCIEEDPRRAAQGDALMEELLEKLDASRGPATGYGDQSGK